MFFPYSFSPLSQTTHIQKPYRHTLTNINTRYKHNKSNIIRRYILLTNASSISIPRSKRPIRVP